MPCRLCECCLDYQHLLSGKIQILGGLGGLCPCGHLVGDHPRSDPTGPDLEKKIQHIVDESLKKHKSAGSVSYSEFFHAQEPVSVPAVGLKALLDPCSGNDRFHELCLPVSTEQGGRIKEADLQRRWNDVFSTQECALQYHDTHLAAAASSGFSGRKPDIVLTSKQKGLSPINVVAIGELTVEDYSPSKMGQLLSAVHRLMQDHQPFRMKMYSFLAGCEKLLVCESVRVGDNNIQSSVAGPFVLPGVEGIGLLRKLFNGDLSGELGWELPTIAVGHNEEHLEVLGFCGRGASADVYSVLYQNQACVAKIFLHGGLCEELCQRELETLQLVDSPHVIKCMGAGKAKVIDREDIPTIILPALTTFIDVPSVKKKKEKSGMMKISAILRSGALGELVDAVWAEHKQGLIDRDVRPANVGFDAKSGVLCKFDLAFAVRQGEAKVWAGTFRHASDSVLHHLERAHTAPFTATKADDLHSVVRTAYHLLHPQVMGELRDISTSDPRVAAPLVRRFWAEQLRAERWASATQAAAECNYQQLRGILNSLF